MANKFVCLALKTKPDYRFTMICNIGFCINFACTELIGPITCPFEEPRFSPELQIVVDGLQLCNTFQILQSEQTVQ